MARSIHIAFLVLFLTASTHAQLLQNGSFENSLGLGDLTYWEHACLAQSAASTAPSSGSWCAEVEASNPQGCFSAWLYQPIPGAYDGMEFFLGGWCRNVDGPWMPPIGVDIGIMGQGGTITPLQIGTTISDTTWNWHSLTDTIHLGLDEEVVVICDPGFVGGPAYALAQFDGIQFYETFPSSVHENATLELPWRYDPAAHQLHIGSNGARLLEAQVFDAFGRMIQRQGGNQPDRMVIDLSTCATGLVVVRVTTDVGISVIRSVKY